jgi:hypothetical protein
MAITGCIFHENLHAILKKRPHGILLAFNKNKPYKIVHGIKIVRYATSLDINLLSRFPGALDFFRRFLQAVIKD